jgi:4-hydroxy-3-polyprenylbenzoate decarboxylase
VKAKVDDIWAELGIMPAEQTVPALKVPGQK